MKTFSVTILPDDLHVQVEQGSDLLKACYVAGLAIDSPCGGAGTCGKCKVIVDGKPVHACQTKVNSDMKIEIPEASRIKKQQVLLDEKEGKEATSKNIASLDPICKNVTLALNTPDISNNINDLDRIVLALKSTYGIEAGITLNALRALPRALRGGDFTATVTIVFDGEGWKITDVMTGSVQNAVGLAIDIGTTTVAVYLVDMNTGEIIDKAGTYNKQSVYGSDVITRIIYSEENASGRHQLQDAVIDSLNELIAELISKNGLTTHELKAAVIAANTVMEHLLLNVSAKYLRLEPYIPVAVEFPPIIAKDIHLNMDDDALLLLVPNVASYVGGDITAGIMVSSLLDNAEDICLFIDIGTNGELVLGNSDWMMTCACSAGPAFEGSGIECGMRAVDGAIDGIKINSSYEPVVSTINDVIPLGICGSGLICLLSRMLTAGVIDRVGNINTDLSTSRVQVIDSEPMYILAYAQEYGDNKQIYITQSDIKNLLRAKAAIFAGIRVMLSNADLPIEAISKVIIAGGFGNNINICDAINIGLLPDIDESHYTYIGNSSVQGALAVLLDRKNIALAKNVAASMTYLELSVGNQFMEEFVSAMFIPHTDLTLFPSKNEGA